MRMVTLSKQNTALSGKMSCLAIVYCLFTLIGIYTSPRMSMHTKRIIGYIQIISDVPYEITLILIIYCIELSKLRTQSAFHRQHKK